MNLLDNVDQESQFVFWDLSNAKNTRDLVNKIKVMPPEIFNMYVNSKKNEFSLWIDKNYKNKTAVAELSKLKDQKEIITFMDSLVLKEAINKEAMLESLIQRKDKQNEKLLQVLSRRNEDVTVIIPSQPFDLEEKEKLALIKTSKKKSVLIDAVVNGNKRKPTEELEQSYTTEEIKEKTNSNLFKEPSDSNSESIRDNFKPKKIKSCDSKELIEKIKEVYK